MAKKLTQKEQADRIRLEILALSDDDLVFAEAHTYGGRFESLADWLKRTAEEARKDVPF